MVSKNDEDLVRQYLKGDENSLEILIKRYLKPIYSFTFRFVGDAQEAEDITQEVFVKVWRNLKKFNPRRSRFATLRDRQQKSLAPYRTEGSGSGFKTWIFAIAKNTSIDWLRKSRSAFGGKKAVPFSEFSAFDGENGKGKNILIDTLVDPAPLPNEIFERANIAQMLTSAMEKLSLKYRTVLFLHYNEHFNFREIAEVLEEPLNTVKSRHRRALIGLRKLLTEP